MRLAAMNIPPASMMTMPEKLSLTTWASVAPASGLPRSTRSPALTAEARCPKLISRFQTTKPLRTMRPASLATVNGAGLWPVSARVSPELVNRHGVIGLAGIEPVRREIVVVRRVREVLRLEAEPIALAILLAGRAIGRTVEEVAGIELQAR